MVIANEEILLSDLVSLLEEAGIQTAAVQSESWRLEAIDEVAPQVIILEAEGEPNAWEISSRIRRKSHVPIITLGTIDSETAWLKAATYGVDFYMERPFSPLELLARIRSLVRRYNRIQDSGFVRQQTSTETPQVVGHQIISPS